MSNINPTVMVVEDEILLLQAITKKLKISNIDVLSCSSAQQALDYLGSIDELPGAIWLDYYLKDMNGLAFMQQIKSNPKWAAIPVIVVSNSASPEKVHNMLALGVKKYLLKAEYRLDEIIKIITDFIQGEASEGVANAAPVVDGTQVTNNNTAAIANGSPAASVTNQDTQTAPVTVTQTPTKA